jgi:hypothetical protein
MIAQAFLGQYKQYREMGEKAMAQVSDEELNRIVGDDGNSIAVIARHVGGNLVSRFTDFLTTDGEKPWRDRDSEFVEGPFSRDDVIKLWNAGFDVVAREVGALSDEDFSRSVVIRTQPMTVQDALCRSLAHTASHVGQIVLVAKMFKGKEWQTLSIPRGQSAAFNAKLASR